MSNTAEAGLTAVALGSWSMPPVKVALEDDTLILVADEVLAAEAAVVGVAVGSWSMPGETEA